MIKNITYLVILFKSLALCRKKITSFFWAADPVTKEFRENKKYI
jgi:hypothetical protein